MSGTPRPYHPHGAGTRLAVRITPKASRSAITGLAVDAEGRTALGIRIAAPPVDGAANEAVIAFLAKALKLRKSALRIASGETARLKLIDLDCDTDEIGRRLESLIGPNEAVPG